jgi:hypothetical protein
VETAIKYKMTRCWGRQAKGQRNQRRWMFRKIEWIHVRPITANPELEMHEWWWL